MGEHVFRFEKWWLEVDGFAEMVRKVWLTKCFEADPIVVWLFKVRLLRRKIKGWSRNIEADTMKAKKSLINEVDSLDKIAESKELSIQEECRRIAWLSLDKIYRIEEVKARQRSRIRRLRREVGIHSISLPKLIRGKKGRL
jgi:hypothetical protein